MTLVHIEFWTDQAGEAAGEAAFSWALRTKLATSRDNMKWRKRTAPPIYRRHSGGYTNGCRYELVIEIPDAPRTIMEQGGGGR